MNPRRDEHPRDLLSAYLDGEVERDVRSAIERHLSGCDSCRSLLDDFRSVAAAAAREAPPAVPAHLRQRIRKALEEEAVPRRAGLAAWFGPHRLGLAAAAAVVLVIGLWALRQGPPAPDGSQRQSSTAEAVSEADRESSPPAAKTGEPARAQPPSGMPRADGNERLRRTAPIPSAKQEKESMVDSRLQLAPATAEGPGSTEGSAPFTSPATELGNRGVTSHDGFAPSAASAPPGQPVARPEAAAPEKVSLEEQRLRKDGEAPSFSRTTPTGSRLVVEYPDYSVSVFEDGTVALSAKEYSCAARQGGARPDPDLEALFALASSGRGEARGGGGDVAPRPVVRLIESGAVRGRAGEAAAQPFVPPEAASEIQARLRALLRDRYLALLQARCGPAPQPIREP